MNVRAVVVDFDGTIAGDQGAFNHPGLIRAIQDLRRRGVKVIINTGRDLDYLLSPDGITKPEHIALFDAMIVECGAAVWFPSTDKFQPLTKLHSAELVSEMRRVKVPTIWLGHCAVMTKREDMAKTRNAIDRVNARRARSGAAPLILEETVNKGSATYLPPGVNKGTALLRVVTNHFGIPPAEVLGAGDGLNDLPFLSLCGVAIVPSNGNARVKALANAVLVSGANADGVAEALRQVLRNGLRIDPPQPECLVA